jgi:hypothetical protein
MPFIIDRLHAATEAPKRPVTFLPPRLDASACADILDRIQVPLQIAAATGQPLDVKDVDKALSATPLSVSDRIRFKQALTANGLLSRTGRAA